MIRKIFAQCVGEDHDQEEQQADRQRGNETIGGVADLVGAFAHQPASAEQGVTETEADAAKQRERTKPAEFAARILPIRNGQSFDEGADHQALDESRDERASGEA